MTVLARPIKPMSGLQDMRRDWRRWSATERCSAVTIMLGLIALPIAMFILAQSV